MIIQRFNLNLIPNQSPVIVHVNQYDTGAGRLIATLYEGNEPYSPNGTAVIQGTKPDGHGFQYTATLDGNVVTADLTEQMSPVAGDVRAQIVVTESSGVTGTFVFIMRVQPSALPNDTEMSESDYQYIEEAIREAQEAVQTAQEATETAQEAVQRAEAAITETQENAEDSEAWAKGTRGGIPVDPTDPTYEHNAEYWAQYAERYAQGGLHYKNSIPFADIPTTGMRVGDMYNITDDFTTDSRFEEGAGIEVKGGTNIAWNSDNKWDVLALPPKTTFNGRSGSILPMAGDYDSKKILLSSALHIGGETQNDVQEALEALSDDGVKSFNGRSGSVLPIAGDYDSEKILLASVLHIGGETQENVQKALEALEGNKADRVDNAIEDNFAGFDADGNLKDSGKNAGDFATPSDIAGQQSLLKDTVGFTGKNLIPLPYEFGNQQTQGGITAKTNADGSITFNGTVTASISFRLKGRSIHDDNYFLVKPGKYIFSCGNIENNFYWGIATTKNNSYSAIADGLHTSTYELTITSDMSDEAVDGAIPLAIYANFRTLGDVYNNFTVYPMIRKADITDPTYEPYRESVEEEIEQIYADNGVLGAKNLLKNTAVSQTINGITFTVNADKSITVSPGTATDNAVLELVRPIALKQGKYILSGCPTHNYGNNVYVQLRKSDNPQVDIRDTGNSQTINVTSDTTYSYVAVVILSGVVLTSALTFKPMLRLASDPDDTYQPYAMTNRELTDAVTNTEIVTLSHNTTNVSGGEIKLLRYGKLRILTGYIAPATADTGQGVEHDMLATNLPSSDAPSIYVRGLMGRMSVAACVIVVYPTGAVKFSANSTLNLYFNIAWLTN